MPPGRIQPIDGDAMPNRPNDSQSTSGRSRSNSRAAGQARTQVLDMLKDDHKRVKKAYREFSKLDSEDDAERCEAIVQQVLADLEVHTTLEEELLYPAAREAIKEPALIDEAEVEHESARTLMQQLQGMDSQDEKFVARFTVLCEYVMHHVKEEENELFPQLEHARLDWESLAREMQDRRAELMPPEEGREDMDMAMAEAEPGAAAGNKDSNRDSSRDSDSERGSTRRAAGKTTGSPRGQAGDGEGLEPGEGLTSRRT